MLGTCRCKRRRECEWLWECRYGYWAGGEEVLVAMAEGAGNGDMVMLMS